MKSHKYLKALFCICLVFGMSSPLNASDISGTWVADVDDSHIEMTFMINGTSLTGTVDNSTTGSAEIREGTFDGSKVSFHILSKLPGFDDSQFKIAWTGEVIGDEIFFNREFAGTSKRVIARRVTGKSENISKKEEAQNNAGSYDHLSGTWTGKVPLGEMYLELQVKDLSVSGTVSLNGRAVGEIKDGKIEDNKITFNTIRQEGFSITEIPFEGVIKKDKIHFSFISVNNGRPVKFIATKMEPSLEEEQTVQESEGPYQHITGKWTANFLNGVMSINFKVKGNKLTGTVSPMEFTQNEIRGGKIKDNKIYFYCPPNTLIKQKIKWEGTIVGDKIQFTARVPTNTFKFTAKKVDLDKKDQAKDEIQLPPTVNPSGTWVMEADGQQIILSLKAFGTSLTGVVRIPPQNSNIMIPTDAKICGDTVSFSMTKLIGPNLFRIPWVGKVVGNEIHFEGGTFNQFEDVIAKKIKDTGGDDIDTLSIKLAMSEEIKNSNINDRYKKQKKDHLALADYGKAMELNPHIHFSYFHRAELYKQHKEYDLALADINKAIELNPSSIFYHRRGSIYYMKKQYDSAIKEYQKAIRLDNNYAAAYNSLAWLLSTCSDEKYRNGLKAIEYAKKAVDLDPESQMFDTLAAAYAEVGDFDMAVKSQEKAIQLLKEEGRSDNLDGFGKRLESYKRVTPWTDIL
jgi:Tfp pilus assembly protein PilF